MRIAKISSNVEELSILPGGDPISPVPSSNMDLFIEEETSNEPKDKKPKESTLIQVHDDETGMPTVQEAKIQAMQMQA